MEEFRDRLVRLMKEKDFNNSSLGREIDLEPHTVKKWVDGKGMPQLKAIDKIAAILQVSPAYLLYGIENQKPYQSDAQASALQEPNTPYGISSEDLIEFYKWKANKATEEAERANLQIERLKSTEVDAN